MKRLLLIAVILLLSYEAAESQEINKWKSLDSIQTYYHSNSPWRTKNIVCYDRDNMILIEQKVMNTLPLLKYSGDGGETWDSLLTGGTFVYNFNSLDYPAQDIIYVVGDSVTFQKYENHVPKYKRWGVIFSSFDKGMTWNKKILDSNTKITHLEMLDSYTGIANKRDASNAFNELDVIYDTLLYTNDGFETYVPIPMEEGVRIEEINIFSEDTLIIRVNNYLEKTNKYLISNDRGNSWSEYADAYDLRKIHFIDVNNAYKIAYRFSEENQELYFTDLYKTTDGGENWELKFTPTDERWDNYSILDIATYDINHILLVGKFGLLYRSTDGGDTWLKEYPGNNLDGGLDLEYLQLRYPTYAAEDVAFLVAGNYLLKLTDEKLLARPYLHYYPEKFKPDEALVGWTAVEGALQYRYQLAYAKSDTYSYSRFDSLTLDTIVQDTSLLLPELESNSAYYARVKAIGDGIESEWFIRAPHVITDEFTSINENYSSVSFSVYPNPASDYIEISINKPSEGLKPSEGSEIAIYDVHGNVVEQTSSSVHSGGTPELLRIDISHLPRGVYFVRIGERVEKFVKM